MRAAQPLSKFQQVNWIACSRQTSLPGCANCTGMLHSAGLLLPVRTNPALRSQLPPCCPQPRWLRMRPSRGGPRRWRSGQQPPDSPARASCGEPGRGSGEPGRGSGAVRWVPPVGEAAARCAQSLPPAQPLALFWGRCRGRGVVRSLHIAVPEGKERGANPRRGAFRSRTLPASSAPNGPGNGKGLMALERGRVAAVWETEPGQLCLLWYF